ncbi:protein kinase domain-containing protein [Lederbergia graminis]|uniref:Serine/threonine protein kinase n=1 Tax=Lederbergia graminis TaxID=735518 RepID=A0ABW0LJY7_9BACI
MDKLHDIKLDRITFQLKEKHDFEWLESMGTVFTAFDKQDSGNISFGIEKDGVRKFVKYAGAKTTEYKGKPEDAISRLKESIPVYEDLQHKHLVNLREHFATDNGYAVVFDWFDGQCLHPHWSFPPPHKYTHPDSPFFRFKNLPIEQRLKSYKTILEFHVHVEKKNYVAVDFYDGSILYDFKNNVTKICDIDFYQIKPFINTMGRLWGSSRFMSPEEFQQGAEIDEKTNVFNMGAIAFGLFGGELDRSYEKWDAGPELYDIAMKAIQPNKKDRFNSVKELFQSWEAALN